MIFFVIVIVLPAFIWLFIVRSRLALAVTIGTSTLTLVLACAISWFFRDGMGPDAVTSEGLEAVRRFFPEAIILIVIWLAFVLVSIIVYRSKRNCSLG